jgi:hypothetical protein
MNAELLELDDDPLPLLPEPPFPPAPPAPPVPPAPPLPEPADELLDEEEPVPVPEPPVPTVSPGWVVAIEAIVPDTGAYRRVWATFCCAD